MSEVRKAVGARMKAAAVALGWGPKEVAARIGSDEKAVAHWFAGRRLPPGKRMDAYADLVGLDAGAFFGERLLTEDVGQALIGLSADDWLLLREEERNAVRTMARALAEARRLEAAAREAPLPDGE